MTSAPPPAPHPGDDRPEPTFAELFSQSIRGAGLAKVAPGEIPTARSLLQAVGGIRGLVEAILPGLGFLVLFAATRSLPISVLVPVGIAAIFVIVRLVSRTPLTQALAGVAGVAVSAGLALFTGRAEDNFVVGILINAVWLLAVLISLAARYPVIGLFVGILANEGLQWRADAAKRRVLTLATWLWSALFAVRLAVEVPLYLAGQVELLGAVKLILGVPFYAAVLWVTWLLVRSVYGHSPAANEAPTDGDTTAP